MTKVRQCELSGVDMIIPGKFKRNGRFMVCWITQLDRIMDLDKVNDDCVVELKGTEGFWKVDKTYEPELDHKEIKRNWHVGGL